MAREEPLAAEPGSLFQRLQQRYGLGQDPLAMDQPFFAGAQRQQGLETLRHLAGFGDMVLLVTGERGSGKTRLLVELVRSESDKLGFHRLQAQELTSEQALAARLMAIAHKTFGAEQSARDAVFGFFKWSEAATGKGQRLVLLLDDADQVPAAVLRMMLDAYGAADTARAAVPVLSGVAPQRDLVGDASGADATPLPLHEIQLRPLDRDELAEYLAPRVAQAGGDASELLSRSRLQQLHTLSAGSLGRLKQVAPSVWLDLASAAPPRQRNEKSLSKRRLLWPILGVVLLSASWALVSWQYDVTSESEAETDARSQKAPIERKIIRLGPGQNENGTVTSDLAGGAPGPSTAVIAGANKPDPVSPEPEPEPEPATEVANSEIGGGGQQGEAPEAATAPESAQTHALPSSQDIEEVPAATAESDGFQPARAERYVVLSTVAQRSGYTAQYIAGYEEKTALRFLDQFRGVEGLVYTRSTRQGEPWFVVFYGQFADRAEADRTLQARRGELDGLGERNHWIRAYNGF